MISKEKAGNIKVCPSCGAEKKSFSVQCEHCGHEFTNTQNISIVVEFENGLKAIPKTSKGVVFGCSICKKGDTLIVNNNVKECGCFYCGHLYKIPQSMYVDDLEAKETYIKNFPIPNDKESILNMLFHLIPLQTQSSFDLENLSKNTQSENAVRGKIIENIELARLLMSNDHNLMQQLDKIEHQIKFATKKGNLVRNFWSYVLILLVLICFPLIIIYFQEIVQSFRSIGKKYLIISTVTIVGLFLIMLRAART